MSYDQQLAGHRPGQQERRAANATTPSSSRRSRGEFADRFSVGNQTQMALLLARYADNASLAAAVLGAGVRTVRRHCRGWPPPPGLRLRQALHRRAVELVCLRCLSDRLVEQARQANREVLPLRPGVFRVIGAAWIADTRVPENLQLPQEKAFLHH
ncbi:hypothetical protein [Streptomyces luteogriseus]|uniref:hypothetical protein n=1 Tax=Streptomyces luteogriseus TaxID=68233 RepID=UPI003796A620